MSDLIDLAAERARRAAEAEQQTPKLHMWACNCGCITFYHWENGAVQCADCKTVQNGHDVPELPAG